MDRNAILNGYITSFNTYSSSDSRPTVEKVLKFSGGNIDIRKRGDIKKEVVFFSLLTGSTQVMIEDEKPIELVQSFNAKVYMEQPDTHSGKDAAYDRMLEITDQLIDWADVTNSKTITTNVLTLTTMGVSSIDEEDGYLSSEVDFQSIIQIS